MSSRELELANQLLDQVARPLLVGGTLTPLISVRPEQCERILELAATLNTSELEAPRGQRARLLLPVDQLGPLTRDDWSLVLAISTLLHLTDPSLQVWFHRGLSRAKASHAKAMSLLAPPKDPRTLVGRFVLLQTLFSGLRTDHTIRWWCGSARYQGRSVPNRLKLWPSLRRVSVSANQLTVPQFASAPDDPALEERLADLLALSPLTDLGTAHRNIPAFRWRDSILTILNTTWGQRLATRALVACPPATLAGLRAAPTTNPSALQLLADVDAMR